MAKGDTPNYTRKQSDKDLTRMKRGAKQARARGDEDGARDFEITVRSIQDVRRRRGWPL